MDVSPETRAVLKAYCEDMKAKHGPNWKEIKAKELADKTAPAAIKLLEVLQGLQK